ncbi:MAG: TatD family hydrolase [Myxococcaceae bacterium]
MIDTHCHLDVSRFNADRGAVLERAWTAGVEGILVPAIGPDAWDALLGLPRSDRRLQVALGIHPQLLPELPEEDDAPALERLDSLLGAGGAVAVGECGLDGPSAPGAPMERQLRVLDAHARLARKHGLPLLVHCQKAHPALEEWLARTQLPDAGVVLHSYSGGPGRVAAYVGRGCHLSFAGPVSWPEARKPLEAVRLTPRERLLVETDAPDQAPAPHRGGRNEPAFLVRIVEATAAALGESAEAIGMLLGENARQLFPAFRR